MKQKALDHSPQTEIVKVMRGELAQFLAAYEAVERLKQMRDRIDSVTFCELPDGWPCQPSGSCSGCQVRRDLFSLLASLDEGAGTT